MKNRVVTFSSLILLSPFMKAFLFIGELSAQELAILDLCELNLQLAKAEVSTEPIVDMHWKVKLDLHGYKLVVVTLKGKAPRAGRIIVAVGTFSAILPHIDEQTKQKTWIVQPSSAVWLENGWMMSPQNYSMTAMRTVKQKEEVEMKAAILIPHMQDRVVIQYPSTIQGEAIVGGKKL